LTFLVCTKKPFYDLINSNLEALKLLKLAQAAVSFINHKKGGFENYG